MLDNTITLPVDLLNSGSATNQVYTRADEYQNRSIYEGPGHTLIAKDTMTFYRNRPTRVGNNNGTGKSAIKVSTDKTVPGYDATTTIVAPLIGNIDFSIPIGCTAADVKILRQRMIAILDNDAIMDKLNLLLHV